MEKGLMQKAKKLSVARLYVIELRLSIGFFRKTSNCILAEYSANIQSKARAYPRPGLLFYTSMEIVLPVRLYCL